MHKSSTRKHQNVLIQFILNISEHSNPGTDTWERNFMSSGHSIYEKSQTYQNILKGNTTLRNSSKRHVTSPWQSCSLHFTHTVRTGTNSTRHCRCFLKWLSKARNSCCSSVMCRLPRRMRLHEGLVYPCLAPKMAVNHLPLSALSERRSRLGSLTSYLEWVGCFLRNIFRRH